MFAILLLGIVFLPPGPPADAGAAELSFLLKKRGWIVPRSTS